MYLALCATSGQHSVDNKPSAVDRCMHSLSAADALFYGFWMMANLVGAIGRKCSFFFSTSSGVLVLYSFAIQIFPHTSPAPIRYVITSCGS